MFRLISLTALAVLMASTVALGQTKPAALVVSKDKQTLAHTCNGEDVAVNGNKNTIKLSGSCEKVVIGGNKNTVELSGSCKALTVNGNKNKAAVDATIEMIGVNGNENTVTWSAAKNPRAPKISNLGNKNSISPRK